MVTRSIDEVQTETRNDAYNVHLILLKPYIHFLKLTGMSKRQGTVIQGHTFEDKTLGNNGVQSEIIWMDKADISMLSHLHNCEITAKQTPILCINCFYLGFVYDSSQRLFKYKIL